jgi:hypothetical protein
MQWANVQAAQRQLVKMAEGPLAQPLTITCRPLALQTSTNLKLGQHARCTSSFCIDRIYEATNVAGPQKVQSFDSNQFEQKATALLLLPR